VIGVQLFTIMVLMALVTTFTTSPVVALLYPPQHRRRFGSRNMEAVGIMEAAAAAAAAVAGEEEEEMKVAASALPMPAGLGMPEIAPEATRTEEGRAVPTAPCVGELRLMLVAQRMTDVPGLALVMELIGPDRVSAVRFVESEEIPLSIIMSQGTLKTGAASLS